MAHKSRQPESLIHKLGYKGKNTLAIVLYTCLLFSCQARPTSEQENQAARATDDNSIKELVLGIERMDQYLDLLKNKNVGLVVNHTTLFPNSTHLADSLLSLGINVTTIFGPEHGFRGDADAGAKITDGKDAKTGVPVISLYGANYKPTPEQIKNLDIVLFDIQDVGVRYYTYPSTLHYVMEACAENGKPVLVLDRPNPNGDYVAGPVLDRKFASFVGLNPVPVVHGLTIGELAAMINGEGWLKNGVKCDLTIIPCENYNHNMPYDLPVPPSPNLPNRQSIRLYPSICLFEPTIVSVGRGTDLQFQVIGAPGNSAYGPYSFTPVPKPGAQNPVNKDKLCYGHDLSKIDAENLGFTLRYVIEFYNKTKDKSKFFTSTSFFDKLAGTDQVRKMIVDGKSEEEILASFEADLDNFKVKRKTYLLYPD